MAYALQQLINGITLGMIYGLIAVGYTMVYGIIGMINFAHGDVFMVGAFIGIIVLTALSGITSVPLGLLAALDPLRGTVRPVRVFHRARGLPAAARVLGLAPLISAIGMSIVPGELCADQPGGAGTGHPEPHSRRHHADEAEWLRGAAHLDANGHRRRHARGPGRVHLYRDQTPLGRSMRAVEQDAKMAALLGIDTNRTISYTFIIGSALAAVAGVMFLLYYGVIDFYIGFEAGIKAFTAAVLGGIGSLPGAVLGGLLIGLIEAFWSGMPPSPIRMRRSIPSSRSC